MRATKHVAMNLARIGQSETRKRAHSSELARACSTERRHVHQPALAVERVRAALEPQPRARADVTVPDLAVIADFADDLIGPVLRQAEQLAHVIAGAEKTLDLRILAGRLGLIDVLRGHPLLLREDHGGERPIHDIAPAVVAMAHYRPDGRLGDDLWQNHVLLAVPEPDAAGSEDRSIGGPRVTAPILIGAARVVLA